MELARNAGWRVSGVEPNDAARERASQFGTVYAAIDEVQGQFDLITAIHVLEHVREPVQFLRQIGRFLGEEMIVVIPKDSYRPPHLLVMTEAVLPLLFGRANLTMTEIETVAIPNDAASEIIARARCLSQ